MSSFRTAIETENSSMIERLDEFVDKCASTDKHANNQTYDYH